ncbi:hypothetical protein PINS_up009096 [Pythium insidiosum]|nr:hypothetical protein PINS_up009096 [Pythium insidiosum]
MAAPSSSAERVAADERGVAGASGLVVASRLDYSCLRDADGQLVELFQDPHVKMDVAVDQTLAIAYLRSLYIAAAPSPSSPSPSSNAPVVLQRVADGHEYLEEENGNESVTDNESDAAVLITDLKWINREFFATSDSTGVLRVYSRDGAVRFAQKFHYARIVKLDASASVSTPLSRDPAGVSSDSAGQEADADGELWVLYEDSTVAIIHIQELLTRMRAAVYGPAQASKFRKYALRDQANMTSAVPCGAARPTIFQSHPRLGLHTVISVGSGPFIAFYQAGSDQNSIIHLAHIATAIASRAAGAVWSFAKSWGWGYGAGAASNGEQVQGNAEASGEMRAIDAAAEHVAAPLSSVRQVTEDPRRRCRMLVLSPVGRLAAVSDTLGRVLLIDTHRMTIIRMWKGYRYAQCGWMHGSEGKTRRKGLYLVIYSAQRGIVEVWRARYGPRVFSAAVGASARLFTSVDRATNTIRCTIFASQTDGHGQAELLVLGDNAPSASTLVKYFTQNKLQEENFLLHHIIGGIQAFVKNKAAEVPDRKSSSLGSAAASTHVLEQDLVTPLLEDITTLVSPTSVQALLDVLLVPEMAALSASFILRAMEQLQIVLRNAIATRAPTGSELSLLWQLQWRHKILSAYIGLTAEFQRSRHLLSNTKKDVTQILPRAVSGDSLPGAAHIRLIPWLELYRRAGFSWGDHELNRRPSQHSQSTQLPRHHSNTTSRAAQLNWWDFMEYFAMPFMDPELPRRRDIFALYERTQGGDSTDEFLRLALVDVLRVPIIRSSLNSTQVTTLLTLLFTPVLSNVFAVQELQSLHDRLFLARDHFVDFFIEWYFDLPVTTVLAIPPPSASSPFQRWLQSYILPWDYERDIEGDSEDFSSDVYEPSLKCRLATCPQPMTAIFHACARSTRLIHVFVLSEHCRWAEQEQFKTIQESTLGRFSGVDGGLRWVILQDCVAETVHLSLRLGRLGKMSVESVENVDDVLRSIALMQLNEGHDTDDVPSDLCSLRDGKSNGDPSPVASPAPDIESEKDVGEDAWVRLLETARNAAQMKSWRSVLQSYPQFANSDALYCFRVSLLCAAWNAERSDMHQLNDAINELQAIESPGVRMAMGIHVWEKFIRVHVATLISFWEESAAGRKPQRGLQPQIARRFFAIIQRLLTVLLETMQTNKVIDTPALFSIISAMSLVRDAHKTTVDDSDADDVDGDDALTGDNVDDETIAEFKVEYLTRRDRWGCHVRDLRHAFRRNWPPSYASASLLRSLASVSVREVKISQLSDHLSLILLLDSFAATTVSPVSTLKLFRNKGKDLCRPETFTAPLSEISQAHQSSLQKQRTQFLRQLLQHNETLGFELADAFRLPTDLIREEHVLFLYQAGKDHRADTPFDAVRNPERLISRLGAIARARLSLILRRMKADPTFAVIMSVLPADQFAWITNNSSPPLIADPLVEKLDSAPSLTETSVLLSKCLSLMPQPIGPEFEKLSAMSLLVKDIIARVKQQQQQQQ